MMTSSCKKNPENFLETFLREMTAAVIVRRRFGDSSGRKFRWLVS
jgi:hypothetical protein